MVTESRTTHLNFNVKARHDVFLASARLALSSDQVKAEAHDRLFYGKPGIHSANIIDYLNKSYNAPGNRAIKTELLTQFKAFFARNGIKLPANGSIGRDLKWLGLLNFQNLPIAERAKFVQMMVVAAAMLAMSSAAQQMKLTSGANGSVWNTTRPDRRTDILISAAMGGAMTAIGMTTIIFGQVARNSLITTLRSGFAYGSLALGIKALGDVRTQAQIQSNVQTAWTRLSPHAVKFANFIFDHAQTVARRVGASFPVSWSAGPSTASQDQFLDSTFGAVENNSTTLPESNKTELRRRLKFSEDTNKFPSPTSDPRYGEFLHRLQANMLTNWINSLNASEQYDLYNAVRPRL